MTETLNLVVTILSIAALVVPVLGGFMFFKMQNNFVTKQQFDDYKVLVAAGLASTGKQLDRIEQHVDKILSKNNNNNE